MSKPWRTVVKWHFIAKIVFNRFKGFLSNTVERYLKPKEKTTVVIEQGFLQGTHYKTLASNKPYVRFLGIPYAKPPVGKLRFKPPVKHPGWSGTLKAFSVGNMSMQYSILEKKVVGSEDCLYLNIFVPLEEQNEKKAVMVFIHGGMYYNGSGSLDFYSPDYMIDENVIVVTINYRLNAFGFLNFDIDECPGNMGLKDQLFAIKWVKANIYAFGGDDQNITIFGESSGSASVHCHILSPLSKGLFQKAIMQSGCMFNPWALNQKHIDSAFKLAYKLGCKAYESKEAVRYLLKIPAIDIVKLITIDAKTNPNYDFVPSVESEMVREKFLPAHPDILVKTASTVPLVIGINNMEGLLAFGDPKIMKILKDTDEIYKLFRSQKGYTKEIVNSIKNFYFNEWNTESGSTKLENICACHADELSYLFYGRLFGFAPKPNSPELRMCKILSKLWTNFAKTGNPNSHDLKFEWKNTRAEEPKYLSLDGDNTLMVDGLLNSSRMRFWENISDTIGSEQKQNYDSFLR
ncbi:hypothetical protein ACI65C_009354 [Semiaphis heraclei]